MKDPEGERIMRILLVEDEKSLSRALCAILQKSGYSADAVFTGTDAVDYIMNGEYDAVILDVMLPGLDGFEVLKKIRAGGSTVPVLMLTARSEIEDRVEGLDRGANDYLTKPFDTRELLARIRVLTRAAIPASTDCILRVQDLSLNQSSNLLSGPGGQCELGNKEFQILEMLMSRPGQIFSAEHMLEKIWGYETEVDVNVVWVNISNLRKKIKTVGSAAGIRAVRNTGYMLTFDEK